MKAGKDYFVTVLFKSYGHWTVEISYLRSRKIKRATTTDSVLVDRFNELKSSRDRGYQTVCNQLKSLVI